MEYIHHGFLPIKNLYEEKNLLGREIFPDNYWSKNTLGCCPNAELLEKRLYNLKQTIGMINHLKNKQS